MAEITSELAKETENEREKEKVTLHTIKMVGAFSIAQFLMLQRRWWWTCRLRSPFRLRCSVMDTKIVGSFNHIIAAEAGWS